MPKFEFEYQELTSAEKLKPEFQELLKIAKESTKDAYAPYSHFKVGAAVLMQHGNIISGINIENASYPVGICAERSALASAISQFPKEKIKAIAISYLAPSGDNNKPAFPCGMCRQFISECEDRNEEHIVLILAGMKGSIIQVEQAKHLLPFSFGGTDLG